MQIPTNRSSLNLNSTEQVKKAFRFDSLSFHKFERDDRSWLTQAITSGSCCKILSFFVITMGTSSSCAARLRTVQQQSHGASRVRFCSRRYLSEPSLTVTTNCEPCRQQHFPSTLQKLRAARQRHGTGDQPFHRGIAWRQLVGHLPRCTRRDVSLHSANRSRGSVCGNMIPENPGRSNLSHTVNFITISRYI